MNKNKLFIFIALIAFAFQVKAQEAGSRPEEEARLLRFPAIHGDQVVFTYAGDLYTVPTLGGEARKLTNHDGFEMFAKYSDGYGRVVKELYNGSQLKGNYSNSFDIANIANGTYHVMLSSEKNIVSKKLVIIN